MPVFGNNKSFPLRPAWDNKPHGNWMAALNQTGLGSRTSIL